MPETSGYALAIAVAVFVAFLVVRTVVFPRPTRGLPRDAKQKLDTLRRRATDQSIAANERAAAWREAAAYAHDALHRPSLASTYALRALKVDDADVEALSVLAKSLRGARRYASLERALWRRVSSEHRAIRTRAVEELIALYEGPMRRSERARGLRALLG